MYPELHKYETHTQVQAVRIRDVRMTNEGFTLTPFDPAISSFNAPDLRSVPTPGGYFVLYATGGTTFLPQDTFESTYSLCDDVVDTPAA